MIRKLRAADERLTHAEAEALVEAWASESKVDVESDVKMAGWLEDQDVEACAGRVRTCYLKRHIEELFGQLGDAERAEMLAKLAK